MKGHAAGWTQADREGLAKFDGRAIVEVVDWYRSVVPAPASELILASGALPSRPAVMERRQSVVPRSKRENALLVFASQDRSAPFTWSRALHFYFDATGLSVAWSLVKDARDRLRMAAEREVLEVSQRLANGKTTISKWQNDVANSMKMAHGATAALALGGWAALSSLDWEQVSIELENQFGYLDGFAVDLEREDYPADGRFFARASQYPNSSRRTWAKLMGLAMVGLGYDLEANLLTGGAENCDECLEMTAWGWVPHGTLIDIGSRQCLNNCACEIAYASRLTGRTWNDETTD